MEVDRYNFSHNKKAVIGALFYEFCGTALITYAFNLSDQDSNIRAIAYCFAFIVAYNVSGSHFNPATSLAVFIKENKFGD